DSTKRSRSTHLGFAGLCLRKSFHNTSAISAMPMGAPGWPEFAFWTASIASTRMAFANVRRDGFEAASAGCTWFTLMNDPHLYESARGADARIALRPGKFVSGERGGWLLRGILSQPIARRARWSGVFFARGVAERRYFRSRPPTGQYAKILEQVRSRQFRRGRNWTRASVVRVPGAVRIKDFVVPI